MMKKKDVTKEMTTNFEKVDDELNRLNQDMFESIGHSLKEAEDAYHDYQKSLEY